MIVPTEPQSESPIRGVRASATICTERPGSSTWDVRPMRTNHPLLPARVRHLFDFNQVLEDFNGTTTHPWLLLHARARRSESRGEIRLQGRP